MRILSITAGAAGMYCGSCFRDNALAAELLKRGETVTLIPVYTPTRTDEPNVSRKQVLFGGISVYLQQYSSLFRKTPRLLDRLWDSPRVIDAFASRAVSTDARLLGDLTISMLQGERGVLKKEFDKLVDWMRDEPRPDIINLPNSLLIGMAEPLARAFGRPVCCTLQGEELFLDGLTPAHRERALTLIRQQVRSVDRFIAVSDYCARFMGDLLGIPSERMAVVPLGIGVDGYARLRGDAASARQARPFTVGYFARVAPEKGLHVLADAYAQFRKRIDRESGGKTPAGIRLTAAGYLAAAHSDYLDEVRARLERAGLSHEFTYEGAPDRAGKLAFLRQLSVLSVPATYDEPKGVFLLEAMASGVPVVQPRRGGFTEILERTGGGLLVEPDRVESLTEGLYALWRDPAMLESLATKAFDGVRAHYTIGQSAGRLIEVYADVLRAAPLAAGAARSSVA